MSDKTLAELEAEQKKAMDALDAINKQKKVLESKADKLLSAKLAKIKELIGSTGITGRLYFDVTPDGITHKIGKITKSKGSGSGKKRNGDTHISKDIYQHLNKSLADPKVEPKALNGGSKDFVVAGMEITATQLAEYAVLCCGKNSSAEVKKMFPALSDGQVNGATRRWKFVESQVKSDLGL